MKKIVLFTLLFIPLFVLAGGELDSLKTQVKDLSSKVDELNKLKDNILLISGVLGVSFAGIFAFIAWKLPQWAKEQVTKKVNELNGSAKDDFKVIRIAIVNLNGSKDLNNFLKELGFVATNIKNFSVAEAKNINNNETDLIFFDNEKNELSDENIKKIIDLFPQNTKFGYLGSRFVRADIFPYVKPSANSRETLNGSLLKLIKSNQ